MENITISWLALIILALVIIIAIMWAKNKKLGNDLAESDWWAGKCRTEANEHQMHAAELEIKLDKMSNTIKRLKRKK